MLCPQCHGKGLVERLPCGECGGLGVVHCCEGLVEQPDPGEPTLVDECFDRLRWAGWSVGEACFGAVWQVDGRNGENTLRETGATQAEAWLRACQFARGLGLLAPAREG